MTRACGGAAGVDWEQRADVVVIGTGVADLVLDAFVETPFEGGRHAGRIAKIASYDKERP